jgi:hypothetical protein
MDTNAHGMKARSSAIFAFMISLSYDRAVGHGFEALSDRWRKPSQPSRSLYTNSPWLRLQLDPWYNKLI